jgi:hypothetical protein
MKTSDVTADIARAHLRLWALRAAPIVEDGDVLAAIIRPLSAHSLTNVARERLRLSQHALLGYGSRHQAVAHPARNPHTRPAKARGHNLTPEPDLAGGGTQHGNPSRPSTNDRPGSAHLTASVAHT